MWLSFWCGSSNETDIRLNLGPVVGTTVPRPELAIGFAERLKAAPEPLPSVIPTINLRTLNVTVMMGVASSVSATTRPRLATARHNDFFAHLGCGRLQLLHDYLDGQGAPNEFHPEPETN
jgi:hypothetical protein